MSYLLHGNKFQIPQAGSTQTVFETPKYVWKDCY